MNKEEYLRKKEERKRLEELIPRRVICQRCHRPSESCLCHTLSPFDTKTHICILIHPMEAKKEKVGTGRLTHASLKNSSLITGVDFTEDSQVNRLIQDPDNQCFVLYPGANAINVSTETSRIFDAKKRPVIFVIDGTWPCAKKMMRESKNIQSLPRISFNNTKKSEFIIKQQPDDLCLSTIESISLLLEELERIGEETIENQRERLLAPFKALVQYQIDCANDPNKPGYRQRQGSYKLPSERRPKKPGGHRVIFGD